MKQIMNNVKRIHSSSPAEEETRSLLPERNQSDMGYMSDPGWGETFLNVDEYVGAPKAARLTLRDPVKKTERSRGPKQKRSRAASSARSAFEVFGYCTGDEYDLDALSKSGWSNFQTKVLDKRYKTTPYEGVVHISLASSESQEKDELMVSRPAYHGVEGEMYDAFVFSWGCVVFWGVPQRTRQYHLSLLSRFLIGPFDEVESDDIRFTYGEISRIGYDEVVLATVSPLEKLGVSFAIAQSLKVEVFEGRVEHLIEECKHIPTRLVKYGKIDMSLEDISKMIGRIFLERSDVNLNSDILDEPEFFWDNDTWEPVYRKAWKYLDVDNRIRVLNSRLEILKELMEMLNDQATSTHSSRLEWIVIWLIVVEILVTLLWDVLIKGVLGMFPEGCADRP